MKIVIDISEDVYTRLFDNGIQDNEIATDDICEIARSIRLGTLLPKGHGRLIDADELLKAIDTWDKFGVEDTGHLFRLDNLSLPHYVPYVHYDDMVKSVSGAETIIEADKAESEDKE